MKNFNYLSPASTDEAKTLLADEKSVLMAGGTDLVGVLKADLLPSYPESVVSLSKIEGLDTIEEKSDGLHIGAMATLKNIAQSDVVRSGWNALADAAYSVASPNIRSLATVGGNICQDIRCWYYRYPHIVGGRINCARKEGDLCYAMKGENQYHSIFGAMKVCETPCKSECPARTDIPAYLEFVRKGDLAGAAKIIMEVNPMPAITSRVCAHFCMEGCNRGHYDESLNIGAIERTVGDYILQHYKDFMKSPEKENGKIISIIGSGPAGLSAAYYLRQAGYSVNIYEKYDEPGGCLVYAIPPYRLPKDIVSKFIGILEEMGIRFFCGHEIGKDLDMDKIVEESDSVLLDTGTWKRPVIGLTGEELTHFGLDFLIDVNKYIDDHHGKTVVVGGGNVAIDVAITAKRLGSPVVKIVCLEDRDKMPASIEEVERALEEGVEIINGWGPTKVNKSGKNVAGITFRKCTRVLDENGRFSPLYDDDDTIDIDADTVFMAIGQQSDLSFLEGSYNVEIERGRIKAMPDSKTNIDGIFAAGDVVTGPATVIKAIAGGKDAAISINQYLDGDKLPVEKVMAARVPSKRLTFEDKCSKKIFSLKQKLLPIDQRAMDKEDIFGLSEKNTIEESNRCFNCGCLAVNPSDMATMLLAYDATIQTNHKTYTANEFFCTDTEVAKVLQKDEFVTEIIVPKLSSNWVVSYDKYRTRKSIDFAILAVASAYEIENGSVKDARIVLGAVAPIPIKATKAEEFIKGKKISEKIAKETAELALDGAIKLDQNAYKIDMAKVMIERSILGRI